ncbi:thymidylate kinase [Leptospira ryugenii]|uniref:Thymidylate kinase n=1 Tax=Leptospira ryugenii TaxID=1917863 RepID=A0A2P2DVN9_9LEPT|nr:dTMP kinase [Leptospira ryugenii]GBF48684.1 thymidylate kinase [Leptospira ryugenii]
MSGNFFVFEGIDGSGKTTLSKQITDRLKDLHGLKVHWHREPTDGTFGKQIRQFLAGKIQLKVQEQMDLFIKDREESVRSVILPILERNEILIQDRYYYSTAAYQASEALSANEIIQINEKHGFPKPKLVIFLDLSPEDAKERRKSRGHESEYFDEDRKQNMIYKNYMDVLPANTIFIDGSLSLEELTQIVETTILESIRA